MKYYDVYSAVILKNSKNLLILTQILRVYLWPVHVFSILVD